MNRVIYELLVILQSHLRISFFLAREKLVMIAITKLVKPIKLLDVDECYSDPSVKQQCPCLEVCVSRLQRSLLLAAMKLPI